MTSSLESEVKIKSPADKFFKRLAKELHHMPDASDIVHGVEVHQGDFETPGSVKSWTYTIDGKQETLKETFEIDEANMIISFVALEGDLLEQYKSYKIIHKVIPEEDKSAVLKIKTVYEKLKETDPEPNNYQLFLESTMKDLDAHLIAGQ